MKFFFAIVLIISFKHAVGQEGKLISDCTIFFDISAQGSNGGDQQVVKTMEGTTKVLYIKGFKSRSDLITHSFKQTTLTDSKTDSTIILRELGNAKYISYLSSSKMKEQNKKYEGIQFNSTDEKKTIIGYECKKVVARLANGSSYNVFYTSTIVPANRQYEYQFKDLPGFVLEYEEESFDAKTKVKYVASKISFDPVPAVKFVLPKAGYRVL